MEGLEPEPGVTQNFSYAQSELQTPPNLLPLWIPIMAVLTPFRCHAGSSCHKCILLSAMATLSLEQNCTRVREARAGAQHGPGFALEWSQETSQSPRQFQSTSFALSQGISKHVCAFHKQGLSFLQPFTTLPTKVHTVKVMVFPIVMYGYESCTIKKAERTRRILSVVLEKTLESPLDCKEIQPVNLKGNQSWIFNERTDAEAPILWPPVAKSWFIEEDPHAGKVWGQDEKGAAEDEMVRQHHWLNGHEFEQTLGDSEGQGSLEYCSS